MLKRSEEEVEADDKEEDDVKSVGEGGLGEVEKEEGTAVIHASLPLSLLLLLLLQFVLLLRKQSFCEGHLVGSVILLRPPAVRDEPPQVWPLVSSQRDLKAVKLAHERGATAR